MENEPGTLPHVYEMLGLLHAQVLAHKAIIGMLVKNDPSTLDILRKMAPHAEDIGMNHPLTDEQLLQVKEVWTDIVAACDRAADHD